MKKEMKNNRMGIVVVFIILAVFNIVVFTIPFTRNEGFWTGYGFSMIALLLTAAVCFYALGREGMKSKFYGVPLIFVVWCYLVIQLTVGVLEMALAQYIPFQYMIAFNAILLGVCLVGLIAVEAGKDEVGRLDEKIKEKVFYIKSSQIDVECLADRIPNEAVKKTLKELAETIRYSDPMSSPQLAVIENRIEAKATALSEAAHNNNDVSISALCDELQQLFAERNRKCKILK